MDGRWIARAVGAGVLAGAAAGCLNVNVPDVSVQSSPSAYEPGTAPAPTQRRTPYGAELDRVIKQQSTVDKEFRQRDWKELDDELNDWVRDVRRLLGRAESSPNPTRMKEICAALLREMQSMQHAVSSRDAGAVRRSLDATNPWLDRLAAEFPTTEPIPESERAPAAGQPAGAEAAHAPVAP